MLGINFGKCRIQISFWFIAVLAFLLIVDKSGIAGLSILAAAIHESGHFIMMKLYRKEISRIKIMPFGIDMEEKNRAQNSYIQDCMISLAGPFSNLVWFGALLFCTLWTRHILLERFLLIHLFLGIFHLLPIAPLDGGQACYSLLCMRLSPRKAEKIIKWVSFFVLLPIACIGFILLFQSKYNFSLLLICIYLMLLLLLKPG